MLLKRYKEGGKAKKKADPVVHKTHREIALGVYKKQMKGEPLHTGYETEYSKSGDYRAFQTTKPYGEIGHLKVTGQAGRSPKLKKTDKEFGRSAGASPLAKAKAHIKKKRKAKGYDRGGKVLQKQSGRESRKRLENAPDLDNDLWTRFQSGGDMVLKQLLKEQKARDTHGKATKRTKTIEKATGLKYPKAAGGSLPLGEGGKKKNILNPVLTGLFKQLNHMMK